MAVNWALGVAPDIGSTFQNAYQQGRQQNALARYATNPSDPQSLNALAQVSPEIAVPLMEQQRKRQADAHAIEVRQRAATGDKGAMNELAGIDLEAFKQLGEAQHKQIEQRAAVIGQAAQWADTPEKWDAAIERLVQMGYSDLAQYKGQFSPETRMAAISAAGQLNDYYKRMQPINMAPGNELVSPTGDVIHKVGFAPWHATVGEGQTVIESGGAPAPSGPMSVDTLRPLFVAQESGGNYSAVNRETGALGAYQVMPQTGASLAQKLGLPWRQDLMTADTPEAKQYQDQIGSAAIQEAIDASGGDPRVAFSYYYGGSDRSKWGPRTQQYTAEMMNRLGGGGTATAPGTRVVARGAPKPAKPQWHTLTPEEVQQAGLPAGVYQQSPDGEIKPVSGTTGKNAQPQGQAYSQSAMDAFDRAIGSAQRILQHPGFSAAVGSGFDPSSWGSFNPVTGKPLGGTNAADFDAELGALKAQVFLPMVQSMKGMGALSNAEGEKLTASIGALDTNMSEGAFKASVQRIIRDLQSYRDRAVQQGQQMATPRASSGWTVRRVQ